MARRHLVVRVVLSLGVVAALVLVGAAVHRLREAGLAAAAQRAEVARIRQALIESAAAAERAARASTPPAVLQARKDAALREFQAAEAEMQTQQAAASQARAARNTAAGAPVRPEPAVAVPRP